MNKMNTSTTHTLTATAPLSLTNNRAIISLARIYSALLEENVSPARTLRLVHAQIACIAALLPAEMPILLHLALLAWAGMAVYGCRKK